MKNNCVLFILFFFGYTVSAQEKQAADPAFKPGSTTIGLSAGFGVNHNYYVSARSNPVFALTLDRSVIDNVGPGIIGFGCFVGYRGSRYNYSGDYYASWNDVMLAVRATYHLTILKDKNNKFDPYAGIMLGARYTFYKDTYYDHLGLSPYSYSRTHLIRGVFVGAKYNFTRGFGAFAEFGYDVSNVRFGINFNMRNR